MSSGEPLPSGKILTLQPCSSSSDRQGARVVYESTNRLFAKGGLFFFSRIYKKARIVCFFFVHL